MRIGFIGVGAMGSAMVKCLLDRKVAGPQDVLVSDISAARREFLSREYGVVTLSDNGKAAENADVIIIAVKPGDLPQVLKEIRGLTREQLVLSIVAGATLSNLRQGLDHSTIVRAMPNMLAQLGKGITVWTATAERMKRKNVQGQIKNPVRAANGLAYITRPPRRVRSRRNWLKPYWELSAVRST